MGGVGDEDMVEGAGGDGDLVVACSCFHLVRGVHEVIIWMVEDGCCVPLWHTNRTLPGSADISSSSKGPVKSMLSKVR